MVPRSSAPSSLRSAAARQRLLVFGAFGVVPVVITAWALYVVATSPDFAVDFHRSFWPAGRDVLHGSTPYPDPHSTVVAAGRAFVYPAPAALMFAVLALLPHGVADGVFTTLALLAVPLTLWVLGIRDWSVYGLVLLWPPVIVAWQTANVTTLLGLGAALVWRCRNRAVVAGLTVALLVSVKVFLWPVGLWLLATRRWAALAWAVAGGLALNLVGWAVLGFDEIGRYLRLMRALDDALGPDAYSLATLGTAGEVLTTVVAAALLAVMVRVDERRGMVLCVPLALVASPLVWSHYFALLLVPLALTYPRLHPAWALPVVALVPAVHPNTSQLALMLGAASAVVAACMRPGSRAALTAPSRPQLPIRPAHVGNPRDRDQQQ
jgi:alpha-1,2-mannosyltransferase